MKNGFKNFFIYLLFPIIISILLNDLFKHNIILFNVLIYTFLLIFFLLKSRKDIKINFIDFKKNKKKYLLIIIKWVVIEFVLMIISNYIISIFIDNLPNNELSNRIFIKDTPFLALSYLILIAPMLEEYIFRYSFNSIKNYYLYVILTSLLFASLHLLSITNIYHIFYVIPYFIISFGFSTIYYKCQNYFASTIAHIIHNILCVIIILI